MDDATRARGEALAFFLVKEIKRHEKDINRALADLSVLLSKGITLPQKDEVDVDAWIEP